MINHLLDTFWAQNRIKPFSAGAAYLYLYIIDRSKAARWENPVQIPTKAAEQSLGLTRKAIAATRRELQERGLIECTEGGRRTAPAYLLRGISRTCAPASGQKKKEGEKGVEKGVENESKKTPETTKKTTEKRGGKDAKKQVLVFPTETLESNLVFPTETLESNLVFPTETLPPYSITTSIYTPPISPPRGGVGGVVVENKNFSGDEKTAEKRKTETAPKRQPKQPAKQPQKTSSPEGPKIQEKKGRAPDPVADFDAKISAMKKTGAAKEAMMMSLHIEAQALDLLLEDFRNDMVATDNIRLNNARQYFMSWARRRVDDRKQTTRTTQTDRNETYNIRRDSEGQFADSQRRFADYIARKIAAGEKKQGGDLPF